MKSAVLLEVQFKDVEARGALMMMNRQTQKMSGSQKKSTQVMRNMMEMAETLEAVKTVKKTLTREKKSTQVMYKLMTVPKDSFVLPFRNLGGCEDGEEDANEREEEHAGDVQAD